MRCLVILLVIGSIQANTFYNDFRDHECNRECKQGETKFCSYVLHLEEMYSNEANCNNCWNGTRADCANSGCNVADGRSRKITTFNRMLPGPSIQVCKGDHISVHIANHMCEASSAVHWHGILHEQNQFMDGAPMITQCPILPSTRYHYSFKATEKGTHFYYANTCSQKADGAFGTLIVKESPEENRMSKMYDEDLPEHVIVVNEWFNEAAETHLLKNIRRNEDDRDMVSTILINGVGAHAGIAVPPKEFLVEKNKKYRFRLIHAGSEPSIMNVTIQAHTLTVISTDGTDIRPRTVNTLRLGNGERYDFILKADKESDYYKIQVGTVISGKHYYSFAFLRYKDSPERKPNYELILNQGFSLPCVGNDINCWDLNTLVVDDMGNSIRGDVQAHFFGFDLVPYIRRDLKGIGQSPHSKTLVVNNIFMKTPTRPLLINPRDKTQAICNEDLKPSEHCFGDYCECVHVVDLTYNEVTELVFVNEGVYLKEPYTIHFHGYKVLVVSYGKLNPTDETVTVEQVKEEYDEGRLHRRIRQIPAKDTLIIPNGGYAVVRMDARNPGYWVVEGNTFYQTGSKLQLVLKVGIIPPVVPYNIPRCGENTTSIFS